MIFAKKNWRDLNTESLHFADSAYYNPLLFSALFWCLPVFSLSSLPIGREKLRDQPSESNEIICCFIQLGACFNG